MNYLIFCIVFSYKILSVLVNCCVRMPEGIVGEKSPADGRYVISILGNPQNYEAGRLYNITLKGIQAIPMPAHLFTGFTLVVEKSGSDMTRNSFDIDAAGKFEIIDNHESKFSEKCPNLITHTNTLLKSKVEVSWRAPASGSGCVNFRAIVVEHRDVWYMDDYYLTKKFCEEQQDDTDSQPTQIERCCACDEAKYELTFEGHWSRHTHPKDFPANNWATRFSDIIGASHTTEYRFWRYGDYASDGLKEVAEYGATRKLESELKQQSGEIRTIIKARGISHPNVTGKTFAVFRVDSRHHLISIVSKIDPSPDWIVGVSALELCLLNCSWIDYKELNLYPWDAGTDSGPSYTSADQAQVPPDVIRRIKPDSPNDPRSPFYDVVSSSMKPLAKIYISRRRIYEKKCKDNEGDSAHIECATTPWNTWSKCNTNCGEGERFRTRNFKNQIEASRFKCNQILKETKKCRVICSSSANENQRNYGQNSVTNVNYNSLYNPQIDCALTDWSEWSECSNPCGKGIKTMRREYLHAHNHQMTKKCRSTQKVNMERTEECEEFKGCGGNILEFDDRRTGGSRNNFEQPNNSECFVSDWSPWSPCSKNCGYGFRERRRDVQHLNNDDEQVHELCKNYTKVEREECFIVPCVPDQACLEPPQHGACRDNTSNFWYFDYSSSICGIFTSGYCQPNKNRFESKEDCVETCMPGTRHPDLTIENLIQDKIDCQVSVWYNRRCNVTCGHGYQIKTRNVIKIPKNGGKPCPKKLVKVDKCFVNCGNEYNRNFNGRNTTTLHYI